MFQSLDLWTIIGAALLVLGTFWGGWKLIRSNLSKVLIEFGQLSEATGKAIQDNKITKEEQAAIMKELKELKEAVKELLKKKDS